MCNRPGAGATRFFYKKEDDMDPIKLTLVFVTEEAKQVFLNWMKDKGADAYLQWVREQELSTSVIAVEAPTS